MVNSSSGSRETGGTDRLVNRRTVLQGLGTGAVAGVGLVGTASGHWVEGEPVFCGCNQLCVCVEGNADVLMTRETDDGATEVGFVVGPDELDPYPDGPPRFSGDFCVTAGDDVPDGKIIGLQVAGKRWVNPNQCAGEALALERERLDSTHPRPTGDSGDQCEEPPCEDSGDGTGGDTGEIEVTWEDCETVEVTGADEGLDEIIVHPMRCFPGDGPCPDGVPGGRTIEDPDLPLTIDDRHLAIDGDEVAYRIVAIELRGDVAQDVFELPDDLDCSFGPSAAIDVTFEDCETATLAGPDEDLDRVDVHLIRCFDDDTSHRTELDGSTGCPTGHVITRDAPDLPLTLGREELALDDEQYFIDEVDLFGVDGPHGGSAEPPEDFDCSFDPLHQGLNIEFEMDDQTITLGAEEDPLSQVTVTGTAEFGFAGWEDLGHAFITVWAGRAGEVDFGDENDDRERYFDLDQPAVVRNEVEITLDVPAEVGDPAPGEVIETEILGEGFFGLEEGTDPQESTNIGDWRENDPMTLRVERRE